METEVSQEQLTELIEKLIVLGENEEELLYWQGIFGELPAEHQKRLWEEFDREYQALLRLSEAAVAPAPFSEATPSKE